MADRELRLKIAIDWRSGRADLGRAQADIGAFVSKVDADFARLQNLTLPAPKLSPGWNLLETNVQRKMAGVAAIVQAGSSFVLNAPSIQNWKQVEAEAVKAGETVKVVAGNAGKEAGEELAAGVGRGAGAGATSATAELTRRYRAGLIPLKDYRSALVDVAGTAEKGSREQMNAMIALNSARQTYTRQVKAASAQESAAAAQAANEEAAATRKAEAEKRAERQKSAQLNAASERTYHGVTGGMSLAGTALTFGVSAPLLLFGKQATQAASDVVEQENKVNRIFLEQSQTITAWAKTTGDALGISRVDALKYTGTYGALLRAMDATPETAEKVSRGLVSLSADLASFFEESPERALYALQAGLVGQVRPLREFGVNLSQTRIQAVAMSEGIVKATVDSEKLRAAEFRVADASVKVTVAVKKNGEGSYEAAKANNELEKANAALQKVMEGHVPKLTALQKAMATYAIIMHDTKLAQGDFNKTSHEQENMLRRLKAGASDMAASFGEDLLPLEKDLTAQAIKLMKALHDLTPEQKENALKWAAIAFAAGPALKVLGTGGEIIFGLGKAMQFAQGIGFSSTLLGIGNNAAASTGKVTALTGEVTALSTALNGLKALGAIAVSVAVAYEAYTLTKQYIGDPLANNMGQAADRAQNARYGNSVQADARTAMGYIDRSVKSGSMAFAQGPNESRIAQEISKAIGGRLDAWRAKNPNALEGDVQKEVVRELVQLRKVYASQGAYRPNPAAVAADRQASENAAEAEINRRIQAKAKTLDVNQPKPKPDPKTKPLPTPAGSGEKTVSTSEEQRAAYREAHLGTTYQDALTAYNQSAPFGESDRAGMLQTLTKRSDDVKSAAVDKADAELRKDIAAAKGDAIKAANARTKHDIEVQKAIDDYDARRKQINDARLRVEGEVLALTREAEGRYAQRVADDLKTEGADLEAKKSALAAQIAQTQDMTKRAELQKQLYDVETAIIANASEQMRGDSYDRLKSDKASADKLRGPNREETPAYQSAISDAYKAFGQREDAISAGNVNKLTAAYQAYAHEAETTDRERQEREAQYHRDMAETFTDRMAKHNELTKAENIAIALAQTAQEKEVLTAKARVAQAERLQEIYERSGRKSAFGAALGGDKNLLDNARRDWALSNTYAKPDERAGLYKDRLKTIEDAVLAAQGENPKAPAVTFADFAGDAAKMERDLIASGDAEGLKQFRDELAKVFKDIVDPRLDELDRIGGRARTRGYNDQIKAIKDDKGAYADLSPESRRRMTGDLVDRRNGKKELDEFDPFFKSLRDAAANHREDLIKSLIGRGASRELAFKSFWKDFAGDGEKSLMKIGWDKFLAPKIHEMAEGFKGILDGGVAAIARIYTLVSGLLAVSGAQGKKRQKGGILGAIVGGIAGSFLGPVGWAAGAQIGASLGGAVAGGNLTEIIGAGLGAAGSLGAFKSSGGAGSLASSGYSLSGTGPSWADSTGGGRAVSAAMMTPIMPDFPIPSSNRDAYFPTGGAASNGESGGITATLNNYGPVNNTAGLDTMTRRFADQIRRGTVG